MSTIKFDREYWIDQLKKEVGLGNIPYDSLEFHQVDFESPFGIKSDNGLINAKEYVDSQLEIIEQQYKQIDEEIDKEDLSISSFTSYDEEDVMQKLSNISGSIDQLISLDNLDEKFENNNFFLQEKKQVINKNDIKYFDVVVSGKEFTVVINDYGDLKVKDQISHIKNTTFFVEERAKESITGKENYISYYQFINLIEPLLRKSNDTPVWKKITDDLKTEFDGLKLEGFND